MLAFVVAVLVVCLPLSAHAQDEITQDVVTDEEVDQAIADEIEENIDTALTSADLHELETFYEEYSQTLAPITGGRDFKSFLKMLATGGADFSIGDIFGMVGNAMLGGVKQSIPAIVQIVVIGLLFSVIAHFKPAFGETGVSKAAQTAQFVIVGAITLGVLTSAFRIGVDAIANMTAFTKELFPLLLALLTAWAASVLRPY